MESSGVFCLVLLWTAVFTAGPGECNSHVYWNREVKDMLPQDQKSMVTIQGWLDDFPKEFQKWFETYDVSCSNMQYIITLHTYRII